MGNDVPHTYHEGRMENLHLYFKMPLKQLTAHQANVESLFLMLFEVAGTDY